MNKEMRQGEWGIILNLLGLLLGFAVLSKIFEESKVPDILPRYLPDDWKGPFLLLVFIFIMSAFLDNIAAALIGGTIALVVFKKRVHMGSLAAIVAASNAGGSGSVLQAESEVAAINMVYGGAACGKKVMTSSSSPGISLKQEGITYIAGAELPCLIVNVVRGGPGLGTIQPAQSDYFQSTKGGGHGDYHLIVLAPASVQEMADFVDLGFELAFKYRNPVLILSDGAIGQMIWKLSYHR